MAGLCACGCGTPTKIATKSSTAKGWVAGQPRKWAKGHHTRQSGVEAVVDEATGCWVWQLGRDRDGYGLKWTPSGTRGAHRVYYGRLVGPIPEGLQLDHLCRVRHCVNPVHLEVVTNQENSQRGLKGRLVTHCAQGHEYTPENTYIRREGRRTCRECHRTRQREYERRKRAEASGASIEGKP